MLEAQVPPGSLPPEAAPDNSPFGRFRRLFDSGRGGLAAFALLAIVLLMVAEMALAALRLRRARRPAAGAAPHPVAGLPGRGAGRHRRPAAVGGHRRAHAGRRGRGGSPSVFAAAVGAGVSALLARASWEFLLSEKEAGEVVAYGIPVWVALLVLPDHPRADRLAAGLARPAAPGRPGGGRRGPRGIGLWSLGAAPQILEGAPLWPIILILVAAMLLGAPLFTVLGGAAVLLFLRDAVADGGGAGRNLPPGGIAHPAGDPALHPDRLPARRRQSPPAGWWRCSARSSASSPAAPRW